jgi:signal peptidase I
MRKTWKATLHQTWQQWRITLLVVVFVILPVKSSLADINWVPTGSMKPTILEGDFLLVNKVAYDLRLPFTRVRLAQWADPQRGDVVICFSPEDNIRLVKRVVGLPGDTLAMTRNQLLINGKPVELSALEPEDVPGLNATIQRQASFATEQLGDRAHAIMAFPRLPAQRHFAPVTLGPDEYFVMGDNRDRSKDSRSFGVVKRGAIVGQAVGIVGSLNINDKFQPRFGRFGRALK